MGVRGPTLTFVPVSTECLGQTLVSGLLCSERLEMGPGRCFVFSFQNCRERARNAVSVLAPTVRQGQKCSE